MNTPVAALPRQTSGGSFLIEDIGPQDVFAPEDLTDVQRQIERTIVDFAEQEVQPEIAAIESKNRSMRPASRSVKAGGEAL